MSTEIPELPEWVKNMVEEARDEGYWRGRGEGARHAIERMEGELKSLRWILS